MILKVDWGGGERNERRRIVPNGEFYFTSFLSLSLILIDYNDALINRVRMFTSGLERVT